MIEGRNNASRPMSARRPLYAACFLALTAWGGAGPVHAQNSETPRAYAIEAGSLEAALNQLARQSQVQIVFRPDLVAGKRAAALSGELTWRQALERLLQGSGLEYRQVADKTIVIQMIGPRPNPGPRSPEQPKPAPLAAARAEPPVTDVERMTVTGTRIRGGVTPSPMISIGAQQIQEEGFTDLGEVVRSLPQNFAGGQNPGVTTGASLGNSTNQNLTGSSALNLRALGPDATLTLLNGRRLSYDGVSQAVDISAIPIDAVERIEIVPDGASAVYGSDAVGGVANVVLKRDFQGLTVGARYGTTTEGGLGTREFTATAGTTWATGGIIATWQDSSSHAIRSDQRDYTEHLPTPRSLYPEFDRSGGLFSGYQRFGDLGELRLDVLRTRREQTLYLGYPTFYYFIPTKTTVSRVSPAFELWLPGDWSLTVGGSWGKSDYENEQYFVTPAASTRTAYCYCNDSRSYEVGAEGPVLSIGGGEARLAIGIGSRTDEFVYRSRTSSATSAGQYGGEESADYAYAEINLPVVSPSSNIGGIRRLEFSAAVRSEDYASFGGVTTPRVGFIYDPSADFTVKASWGKSFKAPTLYQHYSEYAAYLMSATTVGGSGYPPDATVLMSWGGNPDLKPERARTWSASLSFHPEALPNLESELTWFGIDYTDRVVQPLNSYFQALSNPNYAEWVEYSPTPEQQAALLATYSAFYSYVSEPYDPSKVVAIIRDQFVNAARQKIKGVDLSGSYRFDLGGSRLTVRGSASWLDSWQQTSAGQSPYDLAGTIFNPAKYKGRLGAVWARGGLSVSGFANYTHGVTNALTTTTEQIGSFTTLDATVRYEIGEGSGTLSGMVFELAALNLFDRDPPLYTATSASYPPYDSANYSAIGRFLSISMSVHF
ncbi:MAG TPA: TonB-dependent receptor [Fontimonas sp.]